jgi:transposase
MSGAMEPGAAREPLAEVLHLRHVEGASVRQIARTLKMARRTVRRLLGLAPAPPPTTPTPRSSQLDPFVPMIREMLAQTPEMSAPAVLERLRVRGYEGGISILRDRLRAMRPRPSPEAFLTLHFAPAEAVQVDWADFGFALPGCARRVSGFVMVLCYSRMLYLEFTLSQRMGTFLRCMERGLRFMGGLTAVDIFDNMKTVVLEHTQRRTVFNPTFLDYARTRGFAVQACNVARGNEKGRVERPISFVRSRFWPGRRFQDLDDLNAQAGLWRDTFANGREHEVTHRVPKLVFEHEERAWLKPILAGHFDTDDLDTALVTKMFRVPFDRNHYSVPWRLVGQSVTLRADDARVRMFLGTKEVASHPRCWNTHQDLELTEHRQQLIDHKPRAGALPAALVDLGAIGATYFKTLAAGSRSIRRESERLVLMVELFGVPETRSAVDEVLRTGHVGAEYVEYVLRHKRRLRPAEPLRLGDPAIDQLTLREPDLSVYDALPHTLLRDPGEPPARTHRPDEKDAP